VNAANAAVLALTLAREMDRALLFRMLATLRTDIALFESVDELAWKGPTPAFAPLAASLDRAAVESGAGDAGGRPPRGSRKKPG
jgi:hypothetical protein